MKPMLALGVVVCMSVAILGQERDRAKVADKYKWNLADIYASDAAWRAEKDRILAEVPKLREYNGKLGSSPQALADALELMSRLDKELSRLYVYASMLSDLDTRVSGPQGMQQEMQQAYATFAAEASYIEPEILKIGAATIDRFSATEPRLKIYNFYLHDIVRRASHTLSDAEEKILANAGPLGGSATSASRRNSPDRHEFRDH